jgi:hypothetical protein
VAFGQALHDFVELSLGLALVGMELLQPLLNGGPIDSLQQELRFMAVYMVRTVPCLTSQCQAESSLIGEPTGPAALLADGRQPNQRALLAAEARARDLAVAQARCSRVNAAVAAGHLNFRSTARQVAERGEGCRQRHRPDLGRATRGRN